MSPVAVKMVIITFKWRCIEVKFTMSGGFGARVGKLKVVRDYGV